MRPMNDTIPCSPFSHKFSSHQRNLHMLSCQANSLSLTSIVPAWHCSFFQSIQAIDYGNHDRYYPELKIVNYSKRKLELCCVKENLEI